MFFKKRIFLGSIFYWILKNIICRLVAMVWLKDVVGKENIPSNKLFIIVANHSSFMDFMLLLHIIKKRLYFFIKGKYFNKFYWKYFLEKMEHIPLNRNKNFLKNAFKIIKSGKILAIFPEGTRTRTGKLGEFLPGAAVISIATKIPIIPIAIKNVFDIWPYYKKMPKIKKRAIVVIGEPISLFSESASALTNKIEEEIKKLMIIYE